MSNFYEVAKEITIAAIEKGIIIQPGKQSFESKGQISEYNQMRAKEIGDFYKSIASSVNDAMNGNFNSNDE